MTGERTWIGPLTKRQQLFIDENEATKALKEFVPERCQDCWHHLYPLKLGRVARTIAQQELSLTEGIHEILNYTADCTGSSPNTSQSDSPPICPKEEEEKRRSDCW